MSEYTDCYYALATDKEDLISFLKSIKKYSIILNSKEKWIPFFIDPEYDYDLTDYTIDNYQKNFFRYYFGEDHGFYLAFYDKGKEMFSLSIENQGISDIEKDNLFKQINNYNLVNNDKLPNLMEIIEEAMKNNKRNIIELRKILSKIFSITFLEWVSCSDLPHKSIKDMEKEYPDAIFLMKSYRGKNKEKKHAPNQWCLIPDAPACMYLPVPAYDVDENMVERHLKHWLETNDFDNDKSVGFWLYNAYNKALPNKYSYLAGRIMNIGYVYDKALYSDKLRQTIVGILSVSDKDFDWEPYLAKKKGESRI